MNSDVGLGIFSRGRLTRFSPCSLSKTRILAPGDCARHVVDAIKQSAAKSFFIGVSSSKLLLREDWGGQNHAESIRSAPCHRQRTVGNFRMRFKLLAPN